MRMAVVGVQTQLQRRRQSAPVALKGGSLVYYGSPPSGSRSGQENM